MNFATTSSTIQSGNLLQTRGGNSRKRPQSLISDPNKILAIARTRAFEVKLREQERRMVHRKDIFVEAKEYVRKQISARLRLKNKSAGSGSGSGSGLSRDKGAEGKVGGSKQDYKPGSSSSSYGSTDASSNQAGLSGEFKLELNSRLANKSTKSIQYCHFYIKTGKCFAANKCLFVHDPSRVAVCRQFLQASSCPAGRDCPLRHCVDRDSMVRH